MSIDTWAAEGERRGAINAYQWFTDHPEAKAEAIRGRETLTPPMSYEQIRDYLRATYGFPFKDGKAVKAAWK